MEKKQLSYKPLRFVAITFIVAWTCMFFREYQIWFSYDTVFGWVILNFVNFLQSASPLLAALLLWRKPLLSERRISRFILGSKPRLIPYIIVVFLFAYQFLTFYLFDLSDGSGISGVTAFLGTWAGQTLFGGGMEEGGWRGYLQPAFEKKVHVIVTVVLVGMVWSLWHLPLFFFPGSVQSVSSLLMYTLTATATAFTLTGIYRLTGSILLCTLFHGWQNAIVVTIPPNMGHPGFLAMFVVQTVISIIICIKIPYTGISEEAAKAGKL